VLNVPLVIIGTRGFAVLSLFLVGNLLTCCAIIPLISLQLTHSSVCYSSLSHTCFLSHTLSLTLSLCVLPRRVAVIVLNVPLVIIGTRGFAVLSLFLVGNLLTCCAIIPLISGLVPRLRNFITETAFVFGVIAGILGVTACGVYVSWIPGDAAGSFSTGANWGWYANNYDWRPFVAALVCSAAVTYLWSAFAWVMRRSGVHGPGVAGVLMRIPGMKFVTATPNWSPEHNSMGHPADAKLTVWGSYEHGALSNGDKPIHSV
jgi:hypothetical protein